MSVTVDHEDLAVDAIGLTTVGQVLHHVQRDNRLVVNLLIDGARPDLGQMTRVRVVPLAGHTLYIETAEPQAVALDVLADVDAELDEGERLRAEVVDCLHRNAPAPAMERLSGCFTVWNAARESLEKTTRLLRIDLESIRLDGGGTLADSLVGFAAQLRQVKAALEERDYVSLADVLAYEMTETTDRWRQAIAVVRRAVGAPRAA
jgi:hypothetical protein